MALIIADRVLETSATTGPGTYALAAVQAGTEPMPSSPQAFIDTLPAMVWLV